MALTSYVDGKTHLCIKAMLCVVRDNKLRCYHGSVSYRCAACTKQSGSPAGESWATVQLRVKPVGELPLVNPGPVFNSRVTSVGAVTLVDPRLLSRAFPVRGDIRMEEVANGIDFV